MISDWDWNEPINEDRPYQQQKVMFSNAVSPKKVGFMAIARTVPSNSLQEPPLVTLVRSKARPDPKG